MPLRLWIGFPGPGARRIAATRNVSVFRRMYSPVGPCQDWNVWRIPDGFSTKITVSAMCQVLAELVLQQRMGCTERL